MQFKDKKQIEEDLLEGTQNLLTLSEQNDEIQDLKIKLQEAMSN